MGYVGALASLAVAIVVRRALFDGPLFRGEFPIEDFLLILVVSFGLAPASLKAFLGALTICVVNIIAAVLVSCPGDSVSADAMYGIGVSPAEWFG